MTKSDLSIILVRILAIFWIVFAIAMAQPIGYEWTFTQTGFEAEDFRLRFFWLLLNPMVVLLTGIGLLVFSRALGAWLTPGDTSAVLSITWTRDDAQVVAFAVVGLLLAGFAIPTLIQGINSMMYASAPDFDTDPRGPRLLRDGWILLSSGGIQLMIGLGIFAGADGINRIWHKIRTGGTSAGSTTSP